MPGLGRVVPPDWVHVERHAFSAPTPFHVERVFTVPAFVPDYYNQGQTEACCGFGPSIMQSVQNTTPANLHRYDAPWLWMRAKQTDGFSDPWQEDRGTTVRAALEIARTQGLRRVIKGKDLQPDPAEGIDSYQWATSVDLVRAAIAAGHVVVLGVNWYSDWERTHDVHGEAWIGGRPFGRLVGGHCISCVGASDKRQAVRLMNSWGSGWGDKGEAWLPYAALAKLIVAEGECGLVIDRTTP